LLYAVYCVCQLTMQSYSCVYVTLSTFTFLLFYHLQHALHWEMTNRCLTSLCFTCLTYTGGTYDIIWLLRPSYCKYFCMSVWCKSFLYESISVYYCKYLKVWHINSITCSFWLSDSICCISFTLTKTSGVKLQFLPVVTVWWAVTQYSQLNHIQPLEGHIYSIVW